MIPTPKQLERYRQRADSLGLADKVDSAFAAAWSADQTAFDMDCPAMREIRGLPPLVVPRHWQPQPRSAPQTTSEPPDPDEDYGPAHKPGAMMHVIFERIGYQAAPNCGCAAFARQMNQWGWVVCLTTRKSEIIQFFIEQARSQGIEVKGDRVWDLFVGGGKDRLAAIQSKVAGGLLKLLGI